MRKLLITLYLVLISVISNAQNISIAKADIDRAFSLTEGSKLFSNAIFSSTDTLLTKRNNSITSRLSKFQGSVLVITSIGGKYVGRILKTNVFYYELKEQNGSYVFEKKDATVIEGTTPIGRPAPMALEENPNNFQNSEMADVKLASEKFKSFNIPVDNEMALVQAGWGCILLDFNGYDVNSPAWNYGTPFYAAPVTFANKPDSVNYVLNRVKDIYYPFTLVVTTNEDVYNAAPVDKRMRVVITPTYAWYPGVLSVAFVSSFTWGDNTPCFVFYAPGRIQNLKYCAYNAMRTAGYTLSLYSQAKYDTVTQAYQGLNTGFGTGETAWAPMMGNNVNGARNVVTLNYGPTPGSFDFKTDQILIITSNNGLDYRFGSSPMNYSSFIFSRGQGAGDKSILQPNFMPVTNDSASFKISITKLGTTTITASPLSDGLNNDGARMKLEARLYDQYGTVVAQTDTTVNSLSATISQAIAPGTYYLIVRKGELPQSSAPAFYLPRGGYGQYGWFSVTMD